MVDRVGTITTDYAGTEDDLKIVVYRRAEDLLVGKNAVVIENVNVFTGTVTLPNFAQFTVDKVAEGATADLRRGDWTEVSFNLKANKYQGRILMTYESQASRVEEQQVKYQIDAVAKGMAKKEDEVIFTTLSSGAGNTVNATATWDQATADIIGDLADAIKAMLTDTTAYLAEEDLRNMKVFVPAGAWSYLMTSVLSSTDTEVRKFLRNFGMDFYMTRHLTNDALVVIPGMDVAIHFVYNGNDIPLVEEDPQPGAGTAYIVTKYFQTVIPDTTSPKIVKIAGVA